MDNKSTVKNIISDEVIPELKKDVLLNKDKSVKSNNIDWATSNLSFYYVNSKVKTNNLKAVIQGNIMNIAGTYLLQGDMSYEEAIATIVGYKVVGGAQVQNDYTYIGSGYETGTGDYIVLKWRNSDTAGFSKWLGIGNTFFVTEGRRT